MTYHFVVSIKRKPGLSDPEGTTTKKALKDLGFDEVTEVAYGRTISIGIDAETTATALVQVTEMCEKLLANPVIETYTIVATT